MRLFAPLRGVPILLAQVASGLLITLLVVGLSISQIARWAGEDLAAREHALLQTTAQGIGARLATLLEERTNDLRLVRALIEAGPATGWPPGRDGSRELLEKLRASQAQFSWLGQIDAEGRIVAATGRLLEGQQVTGRDWFEAALAKPVHYGDMHAAKLLAVHLPNEDGTPLRLLDLALPLHDPQGATTGVLASHLNTALIARLVGESLAQLPAGDAQAVSILAVDGCILYDSRGAQGRLELADLRASGAAAALTWPGESEASVYAGTALPGPPAADGLAWRIVLRSSEPALQAAIAAAQTRVAVIGLAVGALLTLGLGLAAQQLLRPLPRLLEDMQAFGASGHLPEAHPPTRVHELAALQQAFGDMARRVDAHRRELADSQADVVRALARASEYRDHEVGDHVQRMSLCTYHLARLAGLVEEHCAMLEQAAQLHDVGKIGVPDEVLHKRGPLGTRERLMMQRHVEHGEGMLAGLDSPLARLARCIVASHHERWDGLGYPRGLAGKAIPLAGRIVAICDTFDALLAGRPYKPAWSVDQTLSYLHDQAGRHFDPALVALFLAHADRFVQIRSIVDRRDSAVLPEPPSVGAATGDSGAPEGPTDPVPDSTLSTR